MGPATDGRLARVDRRSLRSCDDLLDRVTRSALADAGEIIEAAAAAYGQCHEIRFQVTQIFTIGRDDIHHGQVLHQLAARVHAQSALMIAIASLRIIASRFAPFALLCTILPGECSYA